jgi:hypothetical protein
LECNSFAAFQPSVFWKDRKTQKWNAFCNGSGLRSFFVKCQAVICEPFDDLLMPFQKLPPVIRKQKEIIHVTNVPLAVQFPFHKMVKGIQITICPELAGEVADGQAARTVDSE